MGHISPRGSSTIDTLVQPETQPPYEEREAMWIFPEEIKILKEALYAISKELHELADEM